MTGIVCSGLILLAAVRFAAAAVTTYVVPAVSDTKLLPAMAMDSYSPGTNLQVTAARGERTSASFVARSDAPTTGLTAVSSSFSKGSDVLPAGIANIRILKCWYQAGYDNESYMMADYATPTASRNYLTPELLLNNTAMVEVEGEDWTQWNVTNPNGKNYLYLKNSTRVDISTPMPQAIDNTNVQDAASLQPADLPANRNRQYVITYTVPANAAPGDYTGTITLWDGVTTYKTMNVSLKVLPFRLPVSPIEYSIYFQASINASAAINTYSVPESIWRKYLQNMLAHGITNPMVYPAADATLVNELNIRSSMGIDNSNIYYHDVITDYEKYKTLMAPCGVKKIYNYGPDESECNRLEIERDHAGGFGHFNAQVSPLANQVFDILDIAVEFGDPVKADAATYHHYSNRIFSYGHPQTVPEWPRTWRYNYGLLLWQNDFDGAMPFAYDSYAGDAWNDFSDNIQLNRGHMFVYPTADGVVDTIQWEGFAEGVNDVKYAAALQHLVDTNNDPADAATVSEARTYLNTLKTADLSGADLDAVRAQLQTYALALYDASYTDVMKSTPSINWRPPESIPCGTALGGSQLNAAAYISGSFAYTPPAGTVLSLGTHTLRVDFTPADTTNYFPVSKEVTITVTTAPANPSVSSSWYNAAWLYRKAITIDHTKVPGADLTDFPVLVSLTDSELRSAANGGDVQEPHGYDIIFVSGDGSTRLAHEIESYDAATGGIRMWVKVPALSHDFDTTIRMYYGNSGINASLEDRAAVWDSGYKGVWHLAETGTSPTMRDSTANANDSSSQFWTPVAGQIGGAAGFNGSSQYGVISDTAGLRPTDNITYSLWVKPAAVDTYIFEKGIAFGGYGLRMTGAGALSVLVAGWTGVSNMIPVGFSMDTTQWQYIAVAFQKPYVYVYYNGALYLRYLIDASMASTDVPLVLGGQYAWSADAGYHASANFNGCMDEFRISGIARSAGWVAAEYNNQSSPSTFYRVGRKETPSSASVTGTYRNAVRNYPNPADFSRVSKTTIVYSVAAASRVSIRLYTIAGELVKTLVNDETAAAGEYSIDWQGDTDSGRKAASGVYMAVARIGGDIIQRKIAVVR